MFADDTNLFISDSHIENLFETMNEELRNVATWFKANKFSLNISRTKCSLFHSTRKRKDIQNIVPPLHIDNQKENTFQSKKRTRQKFSWSIQKFPGSIILIL